MERAIWISMVRSTAIHKFNPDTLTHGQILWISLNNAIDADEHRAGLCGECLEKHDSPTTTCSQCGKVTGSSEMSEEMRNKVKEAARFARGEEE